MMTGEVAQMVTATHEWTAATVGLIVLFGCISLFQTYVLIFERDLRGFRARLESRAKLCLNRTGFVGALIARQRRQQGGARCVGAGARSRQGAGARLRAGLAQRARGELFRRLAPDGDRPRQGQARRR